MEVGVLLVSEILEGELCSLSLVLGCGFFLLVLGAEDKVESDGGDDADDVAMFDVKIRFMIEEGA